MKLTTKFLCVIKRELLRALIVIPVVVLLTVSALIFSSCARQEYSPPSPSSTSSLNSSTINSTTPSPTVQPSTVIVQPPPPVIVQPAPPTTQPVIISTPSNEPRAAPPSGAAGSSNTYSAPASQCGALADRLRELDILIPRNEQAAEQASRQAREACRGDSTVDCGYWTGLAEGSLRNLREFRQERGRVQTQLSRSGC